MKRRKKKKNQNKLMITKNTPFKTDNNYKTVFVHVNENKKIIGIVLALNVLMLLCGYLGEIGIFSITTSVLLGFIPFVIYFYLIYENYAKYNQYGYCFVLVF